MLEYTRGLSTAGALTRCLFACLPAFSNVEMQKSKFLVWLNFLGFGWVFKCVFLSACTWCSFQGTCHGWCPHVGNPELRSDNILEAQSGIMFKVPLFNKLSLNASNLFLIEILCCISAVCNLVFFTISGAFTEKYCFFHLLPWEEITLI